MVSLATGTTYGFTTGSLANGMDTVLRLVASNGSLVLAENDDAAVGNPASSLSRTVPTSGDYYLEVVHKDPAATTGRFDVGVAVLSTDDHGDASATATRLTVGTKTLGAIERAGDQDWFVVTLSRGVSYDFSAPTGGDDKLAVYDAALSWLADDDDSGPGLSAFVARFTPRETGTTSSS